MREGWNFILRHDRDFDTVNLWMIHQERNGPRTIVEPINLTLRKEWGEAEIAPEPTIKFCGDIANDFLKAFADGLVAAGFRPDELKASDKEVVAINDHLQDMRTLVFKKD